MPNVNRILQPQTNGSNRVHIPAQSFMPSTPLFYKNTLKTQMWLRSRNYFDLHLLNRFQLQKCTYSKDLSFFVLTCWEQQYLIDAVYYWCIHFSPSWPLRQCKNRNEYKHMFTESNQWHAFVWLQLQVISFTATCSFLAGFSTMFSQLLEREICAISRYAFFG